MAFLSPREVRVVLVGTECEVEGLDLEPAEPAGDVWGTSLVDLDGRSPRCTFAMHEVRRVLRQHPASRAFAHYGRDHLFEAVEPREVGAHVAPRRPAHQAAEPFRPTQAGEHGLIPGKAGGHDVERSG